MSPAQRDDLAIRVAFLGDPAAYPDRPDHVRTIETHFAYVFLAGANAYKLKKPLALGAIRYDTLEAREQGCRNELRLNRRLAPDAYLAVVALCRRPDGRLTLGGSGEVVDWLVKMRRLAADRMLDAAMRAGGVPDSDLDRAMAHLCGFFRRAERASFDGADYLRRLGREITQEAQALAAPDLDVPPGPLPEIVSLQRRCLQRQAAALSARVAAGRVVDGHGDLRPEHVWLGPPVAVIDCLEFDAGLRLLDNAEEIGFLALECERAGATGVAARLVEAYRRHCRDDIAPALLDFYRTRRALVRAKLAAWHLRDPACRDPARWRSATSSYLQLAVEAARRTG